MNIITGALTAVCSGIGFQSAGDLAFVGGNLYIAASNNHLVRIDLGTGVGTNIGDIGVSGVFGLATADNTTLYGMADLQWQAKDGCRGQERSLADVPSTFRSHANRVLSGHPM